MVKETPVLVLGPNRRAFDLSWRELLSKFDLVYLFVHRDFVAQHKQTILGPIWILFQPLISTGVFVLVFSRIGNLSTNSRPPFLFYLCGLIGWNYFSGVFSKTADVFVANSGVFGKVYFPRILVPIAGLISITINSLLQFALFLVILVYYAFHREDIHASWWMLASIPALMQLAILALGCGMICSSLTAKYRDLGFLVGAIMSMWFYCSPVLYPASQVPEKWRKIYYLNPTAAPLEVLKFSFLGGDPVSWKAIVLSSVLAFSIFGLGLYLFQRSEKTFIDTV